MGKIVHVNFMQLQRKLILFVIEDRRTRCILFYHKKKSMRPEQRAKKKYHKLSFSQFVSTKTDQKKSSNALRSTYFKDLPEKRMQNVYCTTITY